MSPMVNVPDNAPAEVSEQGKDAVLLIDDEKGPPRRLFGGAESLL